MNSFHAHIYFDPEAKSSAEKLKEKLSSLMSKSEVFEPILGKLHDGPIGPHPKPMFMIAFDIDDLSSILTCLMRERNGLTVLIHPETGNELLDHTDHVIWMGQPLDLDLSTLEAG